jgi:hypothetical protein
LASKTAVFLSDVPNDETDTSSKKKRRKILRQWKEDWWPQPPEDALTLSGDILSLFVYSFSEFLLQSVYLNGVFESSTSAADAAKTLDPSGTDITVAATPVWVDPTALGPHMSDQILFWDLQERVTPHFTPMLSSVGTATVALASCWLLAGCLNKAFHMRNTLDCPTERVVQVTGQTWIISSMFMIIMACASQHLCGDPAVAQSFNLDGELIPDMNPIQAWFSVLNYADAEYIFNSLGVVLIWRFLISFLVGGWSK